MAEATRPTTSGIRRLAAIVFTDVVGYSGRMQRDEPGTMAAVQADFARMRERSGVHGGEVLNSMGDGLLLCFPSVVQAVEWALGVQGEFAARGEPALQHRIGIHLGDVFHEDGQVLGDGVNIAARLQTRARPGTVCLSQSVYDAVRGKVAMRTEPLGPQRLKNIAEPMPAYLAVPPEAPLPRARARPLRRWLALAAAGAVLAAAAALVRHARLHPPGATGGAAFAPAANSIAVLPFANMSADKDSDYFAEGVHEDLLTHLANLRTLRVISRTSVMQYRDTTKTIGQIARELGVAYILEGSVRRAGDEVRVTGQLIDARTDEHVWAKSYDDKLTDIFAIQGRLSREIADALSAVLSPDERSRLDSLPTKSVAAYETFLKARRGAVDFTQDEAASSAMEEELRGALRQDPGFVAAWTVLAHYYVMDYFYGRGTGESRRRLAHEALAAAKRLDPKAFEVMLAEGDEAFYGYRDFERAAGFYRQANEAYPNRGEAYEALALVARRQGRLGEAVDLMRAALALDPRNLEILQLLLATLTIGQHWEEAARTAERIIEIQPGDDTAQFFLHERPFEVADDPSAMEAWIASWTPAYRDSEEGISIRYAWAVDRGDVDMTLACGRLAGFDADAAPLVFALRRAGRDRDADEVLAKAEASSVRALRDHPEGALSWADAAGCRAVAGDRAGALAAIARARALLPESRDQLNGIDVSAHCAIALSILGDRDATVAELRRLIRLPSAAVTVPALRHNLTWVAIRDDPRVRALAADPANLGPRF